MLSSTKGTCSKKHYLKKEGPEETSYLNRNKLTKNFIVFDKKSTPLWQTKFTDEEIKDIENRCFSLEDFEMIEVEE